MVTRGTRAGLILGVLAFSAVAAAITAAPALALSPSVETLPASSVAETTATLNGKVNPNGLETKFYFEYGTTESYGSKTSEVSAGSGTTTLEKSQGISGLKANTTYHFRIVASNSSGTSHGANTTFATAGPPSVETKEGAPDGTGEAATLNAMVDPNGQATTYQFEYGTTSGSYTKTVPIPAESAGSGFEPVPVSYKVTGLSKGTQYYFRVTATNAGGKVNGSESSFKTPSAPVITDVGSYEVGGTSAKMVGLLNTSGLPTKYQFEYGTSTEYGLTAPETPKEQTGIGPQELASGLSSYTTYHFRLRAENALGIAYSEDETFTTRPQPKLIREESLLEPGATVEVSTSSLLFTSLSGTHVCNRAEFTGELTQNPGPFGAVQSVTTARADNGEGGRCSWKGAATIEYKLPTSGITIEYTNESEEGFVKVPTFNFTQAVYVSGSKTVECEYKVELTGLYGFGYPLELALGGWSEPVAPKEGCPPKEVMEGMFYVNSGGLPVEAER